MTNCFSIQLLQQNAFISKYYQRPDVRSLLFVMSKLVSSSDSNKNHSIFNKSLILVFQISGLTDRSYFQLGHCKAISQHSQKQIWKRSNMYVRFDK